MKLILFALICVLTGPGRILSAEDLMIRTGGGKISMDLPLDSGAYKADVDYSTLPFYRITFSGEGIQLVAVIDHKTSHVKMRASSLKSAKTLISSEDLRSVFTESLEVLGRHTESIEKVRNDQNREAFRYLYKMLNYAASVPADGSIEFYSDQKKDYFSGESLEKKILSWTDLCPFYGQSVRASWTGEAGRRSANYIVGGHGFCAGRCGAGCIMTGDPQYSQDCLNHDACADREGQQLGVCADEWQAASDDFWLSPDCPGVDFSFN